MKRMLLAVGGVFMLASAPQANAQFISGSFAGSRSVSGFGGGFGFSYHRHGLRIAGFAGGYSSRSAFVGPFGPAYPNSAPFGSFGFGPGFSGPAWGWNSFAPPVVIVPPPVVLLGNADDLNGRANAAGNLAVAGGAVPPRAADEPRPINAKPGDFLVIEPRKLVLPPGGIAGDVDRVAPVVRAPAAGFKFDPFAVPLPLKAEKREADPDKELARLLKLGREAFARGEYGAAGEHFERAALANPRAAEPHFLKAHAAFAAGAYADAVAGIRAGLALDPAWPATAFDPKEPYGLNPAAFTGHLAELRRAAAANPGEPTLEFLLGYQLWFIGEKVEAKKWFAAAEKNLAAPGPIALFK